jgi:hypothetical protein
MVDPAGHRALSYSESIDLVRQNGFGERLAREPDRASTERHIAGRHGLACPSHLDWRSTALQYIEITGTRPVMTWH